MTTDRITPEGFLYYKDYVKACHALEIEPISALAFSLAREKAVTTTPLEAKVASLELWRIEIDRRLAEWEGGK